MTRGKTCLLLWAITSTVLLTPFFYVTFPPATDLPQHLGQIVLLGETLRGQTDALAVNWIAPNNLVYIIVGMCAAAFPPPLSGKVVMMVLVTLWVAAAFYLAWHYRRPVSTAVLAGVLAYNVALYWGFINFMVGWPVFALWIVFSERPATRGHMAWMMVLALLLYASHALWFAAGVVWLFAASVLERPRGTVLIRRLTPVVPVVILALFWYRGLAGAREASGADTAAHWFFSPPARLTPTYLTNAMFGGIKGGFELVAGSAMIVWIVFAIATNRHRLRQTVDRRLLLCGLVFTAFVLLAPEKYMDTILFSQRWFPCAMTLLVLALPVPAGNARAVGAAVAAFLLLFSGITTRTWRAFERDELSGLMESLDVLPRGQRVIGLDFVKRSRWIKARPFLQIFAYAQVMRGASLNFSFAEHASGLVRRRDPANPWTPGLAWKPEQVRPEDFAYFDYALINADDPAHKEVASLPVLEPLVDGQRWRLYRIVAGGKIPEP